MNCTEASELLAAAVLGDLDRDRQRALHIHLAGCDRCLEEEGELFETMHLLRAQSDEEPGGELHHTVMARAAGTAATADGPLPFPHRRVGLLTQTLLTAAATALIVVGLQAALESPGLGGRPSPSGIAIQTTAFAGGKEQATAPLLQGTLFDRQRDIPDNLRHVRQQLRRGDTLRPLDL